jgi:hypothetical protein
MPATLVASMYGMNFKFMPELNWEYGYVWAIILMLIVSGLTYWFFKFKKWLLSHNIKAFCFNPLNPLNFFSGCRTHRKIAVVDSNVYIGGINIADEYFGALEDIQRLEDTKAQLEKDVQHYIKMWDEAKKSFVQYKDNAAKVADEKQKSEEKYKDLEAKCSEFENMFFDLQMENLQLKNELEKYKRANEI